MADEHAQTVIALAQASEMSAVEADCVVRGVEYIRCPVEHCERDAGHGGNHWSGRGALFQSWCNDAL